MRTLEVFGADGVTPVLTYDLSAVMITSVQHASSGCDAAPTESIALRFAEKVTLATP
jgi:type VI protein secretion system component Hcp